MAKGLCSPQESASFFTPKKVNKFVCVCVFGLGSMCGCNWKTIQGGPLTNYKWVYKPYKWPYKWVTGVITPISGVVTPFITGRGPPCRKVPFFRQQRTVRWVLGAPPVDGYIFFNVNFHGWEFLEVFCFLGGNFPCLMVTLRIIGPSKAWRHFEDPTPAIQVQNLPLEGPRSLG